jgi:16S rRNA processing protein RimM
MAIVGWIARAQGNRGEVVVNPETDFAEERFRPGAMLFAKRGDRLERVDVISLRFHRGRPIIGVSGVSDIDGAEALAGSELRVPRGRLQKLGDGQYYHHDLVGCQVRTRTGDVVGIVRSIDGQAGASWLVIEGSAGEVLVPFAQAICTTIDPVARTIVIEPPDGLLELNQRSGSAAATDRD